MATIKLYINTDRGDISRAFVKSTSEPTTESNVPALVAGNKRNVEVYLIDSAGNYDARSGASNYALSIGAGPLAGTPSSGTFTLTDGTETTTALAHNASAQVVEDALNALNSSAGPFSKLVDVTSAYDGNYLVKFRTTGAVAALAGDASELSPQSAVVVDEARAGDGSTKEQQFIRLLRQPAIFQDSFTQIANGWSGELSANNARVLELMVGRDTIAIPLDVELTETGNDPETIARGNMLLSNEVINPASIDPGNLAQLLTEALGDARYLRTTSNLSDVTNAATARSNIGAASDADLDLKADATALTTETNARIDADNRREFSGGVYFDGQTGYADLIYQDFSDQNFSIGLFLSLSEIPNSSVAAIKYGRSGTSQKWTSISYAVGAGIRFSLDDDTGVSYVTASNIIANKTYFVLGVRDGNTQRLYIDGIEVGTTDITGYGSISNVNQESTLGASNVLGVVQGFWPGFLSNAFAFNTALTATQAAELYQQGLQPWLAANPEYRRGGQVFTMDNGVYAKLSGTGTISNATNTGFTIDAGASLLSVWSSELSPDFILNTNLGDIYRVELTASGLDSTASIRIANRANGTTPLSGLYDVVNGTNTILINADLNTTSIYATLQFTGFNSVSGGSIQDITVTQIGPLATLPLDDDCRQLKDISGNRNDATASESGVTHLKQKDLHAFRDDHADGTGGSYLIANADILAENEVITGVTVDGRFYAASGAQDLTKRRIKLQDHGSHVDVKRSNGTTDDSAIAITNPSDGTDFAISVLTQRI